MNICPMVLLWYTDIVSLGLIQYGNIPYLNLEMLHIENLQVSIIDPVFVGLEMVFI